MSSLHLHADTSALADCGRRPDCGSTRISEADDKIDGRRRHLYRAIDKLGNLVEFLLTAKINHHPKSHCQAGAIQT
jgi:transposase-like protein